MQKQRTRKEKELIKFLKDWNKDLEKETGSFPKNIFYKHFMNQQKKFNKQIKEGKHRLQDR